MPFSLKRSSLKQSGWLLLLVHLALLGGALAGASLSTVPAQRFSFYFVSGILGVGAYLRLMRLFSATRDLFKVDLEGMHWRMASKETNLPWEMIDTVLIVTGRTPVFRITTRMGEIHRLPLDCKESELDDLMRVFAREIMPLYPGLRIYLDGQAFGANIT
ncbi:MAG: hypothetical protein V1918_06730 [Planctomycetota bacterium]